MGKRRGRSGGSGKRGGGSGGGTAGGHATKASAAKRSGNAAKKSPSPAAAARATVQKPKPKLTKARRGDGPKKGRPPGTPPALRAVEPRPAAAKHARPPAPPKGAPGRRHGGNGTGEMDLATLRPPPSVDAPPPTPMSVDSGMPRPETPLSGGTAGGVNPATDTSMLSSDASMHETQPHAPSPAAEARAAPAPAEPKPAPAEPPADKSAAAVVPPAPREPAVPPAPSLPPLEPAKLKPAAYDPIDTPLPPPQPPQEPVHAPSPPLLFEVAWEVCWQLGGIYTVLRSKAGSMMQRWGDRYCLIGPYNPATAALEFEERPTEGVIRDVLDQLRNAGMPCHYGRWLIAGRPRVILLDHRARYPRLGEDKYLYWRDHGIALPDGDGEVNDVVAFGFAVAEFFRVLSELKGDQPLLAHFHEWMGGAAVPRIAHMRLPVTTVFTTHATLLGRYLAGDNPQFYDHLPYLNGDELADKYRILPRHQIEKAAAHASVVFTTVSEVTNSEAAQLLGRGADVIVPNGLNLTRFHALHEFQNLHARYKERIHQFVMGHFFPSYTFDLEKTLYLFTSGRYEYTNKGMDVFIEALARLNQRLKGVPDAPTVVAFIVTRAGVRHFNVEALRSQAQFRELQNTCAEQERSMGRRLLMSALTGRLPALSELITPDASVRLKRAMHAWRSVRQPLIVTHDLIDDAGDPILKHLRHRGLFNAADDPVKVIFHPEFLSATSPLISLDYDSFVRGCHLGIFPSYYEPWGYTPLEAIALGVPAVTTDLSGFGTYVQRHVERHNDSGIYVMNRRGRSFEASTEELTDHLLQFCSLNRRQRIELRNRVERLSDLFDWERLVSHYHEAHDLALERTLGRRPGKLELKFV